MSGIDVAGNGLTNRVNHAGGTMEVLRELLMFGANTSPDSPVLAMGVAGALAAGVLLKRMSR